MLFYELDRHLHDSILNFKLSSKHKPKTSWIIDFSSLFFSDESCNEVAIPSAPIWQAIRSSLTIIRGAKSTNTRPVLDLNSKAQMDRDPSMQNTKIETSSSNQNCVYNNHSIDPLYAQGVSSFNHQYIPNCSELPYQQLFTNQVICYRPIFSSFHNNHFVWPTQGTKVTDFKPNFNQTSTVESISTRKTAIQSESKNKSQEHSFVASSIQSNTNNYQREIVTNILTNKKSKRVKIKEEKNHVESIFYNENHPKDLQESLLLNELRSMGFTSTREALSGIRFAAQSCSGEGSIVEQAMIWIVVSF